MRPRVFFFALCSTLVATPAWGAAESSPLVYAVVVGHNDGWGLLPELRFADDDALRFYRLAARLAPRENIALLTELDVQTWRSLQQTHTTPPPYLPPTKKKLHEVIALFKRQIAVARQAQPNRPVHLYFFFSGHGEKGYFLLKKKGAQLREAAFTAADLRRAFDDSPATLNSLFIDACKSQSLFRLKGPLDKELGPDFSTLIRKVEGQARKQPIGVITSTLGDRPAGEARDIGAGYFSHVLISGLSGGADADSDGVVRYGELAAFVSFHTRRISGQQPWFRPPRGKLDAPLVRLEKRRDVLELPPGLGGHFAIFEAQSGALQLEVHKGEAQHTRLIVDPGDYRVIWVKSRRFGLQARVKIADGPKVLAARDFTNQVALGALALKGTPPVSAPAEQRVSSFDPAQSGFGQPFSTQVVEMLRVAYSSGQTAVEPLAGTSIRRGSASAPHQLRVGYLYGGAPASPYEHAHGLVLGYRQVVGDLWGAGISVGGRAGYAYSSHADPLYELPFSQHRVQLQAEGALSWSLGSRLALSVGAYLGWQLVMLLREEWVQGGIDSEGHLVDTLTGDALSWRTGLFAGLAVRVVSGLWLELEGGGGLELLRELDDGERTLAAFFRPQLFFGVRHAF